MTGRGYDRWRNGRRAGAGVERLAFADAWAVVSREAAPYPTMMLTVGSAWDGVSERTELVAGLILAVPTPLRAGAVYAADQLISAFRVGAVQRPMRP